MPTLSPLKKTLLASAFIAPLVLGACSSESEENTEAQEAASTTVAAGAVAKQGGTANGEGSDAAESDTEKTVAAAAEEGSANNTDTGATGNSAAGDDIDPAAAAVDPLGGNQLTFAELAPVEGGQPANETDRAEIKSLVTGMYDAATLHGILSYLPANSCNEVVQEAGGPAAFDLEGIPDLPLDSVQQYTESNPHIDAIEDIQVEGDTASASVTATSKDQAQTKIQRFRHEDGAWKFCN